MHRSAKPIRAIYENGVFKPKEPVELPERAEVEIEARLVDSKPDDSLERIHELLSKRFDSGEHDVAERHNEHQP